MKLYELYSEMFVAIKSFTATTVNRQINDPSQMIIDEDDTMKKVSKNNGKIQFELTDAVRKIQFEVDISVWDECVKQL